LQVRSSCPRWPWSGRRWPGQTAPGGRCPRSPWSAPSPSRPAAGGRRGPT